MISKIFSNLADSVKDRGEKETRPGAGVRECWLSEPGKLRCSSVLAQGGGRARAGGGITECESQGKTFHVSLPGETLLGQTSFLLICSFNPSVVLPQPHKQ